MPNVLMTECVTPADGLVIHENTRLAPGVHFVPGGLTIDADGVVLDGTGATLVGDGRGSGVTIRGRAGVTVRNLRIRDYYHGLVARRATGLTLARNQVRTTDELGANTVFLDVWRMADNPYGGAILLDHVTGAEIVENDVQHQMNGLLAYHCEHINVRRNQAGYNSGWGLYLNGTCESVVEENWADFCNRYQPRDQGQPVPGVGAVGHVGADAAGIVLVNRACRNVIRRNSARACGDGVFLAGWSLHGGHLGCDGNRFEENDCSLSPNIAFEATFSSGNVFRNNWADRCNYGFWVGYSSDCVLEGNRMLFNRQAGIAGEHAVGFRVRNNDFQSNGHGILLWTKYLRELYDALPGNRIVRDWLIEGNRFFRNGCGIAIRADRDHGIRPTPPADDQPPELRPRSNVIRGNDLQDNRVGVHIYRADRTVIEKNKINQNVEADLRLEDDGETELGHNLGLRGGYL